MSPFEGVFLLARWFQIVFCGVLRPSSLRILDHPGLVGAVANSVSKLRAVELTPSLFRNDGLVAPEQCPSILVIIETYPIRVFVKKALTCHIAESWVASHTGWRACMGTGLMFVDVRNLRK